MHDLRIVHRAWPVIVMLSSILAQRASADEPAVAIRLDPALRARCLARLREGLASDEFWPAIHAAEALTRAGQPREVLDALAKRAAGDDQMRCGLARERIRAGDRAGLAMLVAILGDPGSIGRVHAAESLFKLGEVGDEPRLRAAFAQDESVELKIYAAAALARRGDAAGLEHIRGRLTHPKLTLRRTAAWLLGQLGSAADVALLRAQQSHEDDPLSVAFFSHALAQLGDAQGRAALGRNLNSDDPAIRTYAAEFAGHCRAVEDRARLVELLDDPTLDVRIRSAQALFALAGSASAGQPSARAEP